MLRAKLDSSSKEQARQSDMLHEVREAADQAGVRLEGIGLQNSEVAAMLQRAELTSEASGRSLLAMQCFIKAVAGGSDIDRAQALRMLEETIETQYRTLPSSQGAATF